MMTIAERRVSAFGCLNEAKESGKGTDWKMAALALAAVVPKTKPKGCIYPYPIAVAEFDDGITVRMGFWSLNGKELDWDRALRICRSAYQCKIAVNLARLRPRHYKQWDWNSYYAPGGGFDKMRAGITLPVVVSLVEENTGQVGIMKEGRA